MRRPAWLFLALLAAAARADKVDEVFQVWDLNEDGVLTRDEIADAAVFDKLDGDRDGKGTRAEVQAFLGVPPPEPKPAPAAEPEKKEGKSDGGVKAAPRTRKGRVQDFFERFDANKDGKVQASEFQAGAEVFQRYDRNRDGALREREVARYLDDRTKEAKRNPRPDNFFELFDENGDGKVTRKEYDGPGDFFRRYDHDGDDAVTQEELDRGPDAGRLKRMEDAPRPPPGGGPTPLPRRGLLERYDKDGDGRVTLEELGGAETVLRRLDRNSDGLLTGSEVR
ncbi:MAG: EF-hand domain-containing protein [Planctomycetota bacterium]